MELKPIDEQEIKRLLPGIDFEKDKNTPSDHMSGYQLVAAHQIRLVLKQVVEMFNKILAEDYITELDAYLELIEQLRQEAEK